VVQDEGGENLIEDWILHLAGGFLFLAISSGEGYAYYRGRCCRKCQGDVLDVTLALGLLAYLSVIFAYLMLFLRPDAPAYA